MSIATLSGKMAATDALADKECAQIEDKRAAAALAREEPCPDPDAPTPALADHEKNGSRVGDKHPLEFTSEPPANGHANGANGEDKNEATKNGCHFSESVVTGVKTNGKDTESDHGCRGESSGDVKADDKCEQPEDKKASSCTEEANGAKCHQGDLECGAKSQDKNGDSNGAQGQSNPDCGSELQERNGEANGTENKDPHDKDVAAGSDTTNGAKHAENMGEAKVEDRKNSEQSEQDNKEAKISESKESELCSNKKQEESNMSIDNEGDSGAAIDSNEKVSTPTITITEAEPAKEELDDEVQIKKPVAESKPDASESKTEKPAAEANSDDGNSASKPEEAAADSKPDAE